MRFSLKYALLTSLLLILEIFIACYINDTFIRPFLGDVLVVILLYCGISAFAKINKTTIALMVLLFAFVVEITQATPLIELLGLEEYKIAKIILGSTFDWKDLIAYTMGFIIILVVERLKPTRT